jgi:hypothetical protein
MSCSLDGDHSPWSVMRQYAVSPRRIAGGQWEPCPCYLMGRQIDPPRFELTQAIFPSRLLHVVVRKT